MKKLNHYTLIILFNCLMGNCQITFNVTVPENTPENATVYIASSLNNWNAADANYALKKKDKNLYYIQIPGEVTSDFEYKFTLGNWDNAEADANGNASENRKLVLTGEPQIINNTILSWTKPVIKAKTASANVKILSENFSIPQLNTTRKIWLYLPPDYHTSHKKYPVIYMEDGQNLFDESTSFSGEWKVDETLDNFAKSGKMEAIVVGIDNGANERLNEYSPWKNEKYGGGKGDAFTEFLVDTLKPFIDRTYRTKSQPNNTAIIGSSMGGLISLYAAAKYPEKFGKVGIFSPAFWFAEKDLQLFLSQNRRNLKKTKFYFLAGTSESETMVQDAKEITNLLKKKGVPEKNIFEKYDSYGKHTESYWAKELPEALLWLFKKN